MECRPPGPRARPLVCTAREWGLGTGGADTASLATWRVPCSAAPAARLADRTPRAARCMASGGGRGTRVTPRWRAKCSLAHTLALYV